MRQIVIIINKHISKFMLSYKGLTWQDYILFLIIKLITNILINIVLSYIYEKAYDMKNISTTAQRTSMRI
jgi:hypothetical protein